MARTRTLTQLREDVRWQFDFESMTGRVTDAKLTRAINQSIQELRELVSDAGNPYFLATPQTGSLTVGATSPHAFGTIDLPATFLRVYGLDILHCNEWVSLKPANFEERTMWGDGVTNDTPQAFFLFNASQLGIVPAPDQGYSYKLYYLPVHTDLVDDADEFDGIAGWEDWVVFNTGNRLLLRDNQAEQYAAFTAERDRRLAGILARSNHRQRAGATGRLDVRGRGGARLQTQRDRAYGGPSFFRINAGDTNHLYNLPYIDARHHGTMSPNEEASATAVTTVINAAITAAAAAAVALTGACAVQLPDGLYYVNDAGAQVSLTMKAGVWLRGTGRTTTTLKLVDGGDAHVFNAHETDNWAITDMTVDGNKAGQPSNGSTHGIRSFGGSNIRLERLIVKNCRYYGIGFQKSVETGTTDSVFRDLEVFNCGRTTDNNGDGIDVKLCERCTFENIETYENEQRGLDIRGRQVVFHNVWAWDNFANGISLRQISDSPQDECSISATNCYSWDNGDQGFLILNNELPIVGQITRYRLVNCWAWGNGQNGFHIDGSTMDVVCINCDSHNNGEIGFQVSNTDETSEIKFIGCDAYENQDGGGFESFAPCGPIECYGCKSYGNVGTNQVTFAASFSKWYGGVIDASGQIRGITINAAANNCIVDGARTKNGLIGDCVRVEGDRAIVSKCSFEGTTGSAFVVESGAVDTQLLYCDFTGISGGGGTVGDSGTRTIRLGNTGGVSDRTRIGTLTSANIASGVLTVSGNVYAVDGEGGASDDLVTISGGLPDQLLYLQAYDDSHTITVKHGTGNIFLSGSDFALDHSSDRLVLMSNFDGSNWYEISRSNNA